MVLRFKEPGAREWRVPGNLRVGRLELPIGLMVITLVLFFVATVNLFTKQVATISGISFTLVLYALFVFSEHATARRRAAGTSAHLDQFQLVKSGDVDLSEVEARPGNVLAPVRDYNTLKHLHWALENTETGKRDIVVMTVRLLEGPDTGFRDLREDRLFTDYEQLLFTRVVAVAERHGKPVKLLVVPSSNVFDAVAQTAVRLSSTEIVVGESAKFSAAEQARALGEAWDRAPGSADLRSRLIAYRLNGDVQTFPLGPHAPMLDADDIALIHELWLKAIADAGVEVHHRDIVRVALEELKREWDAGGQVAVARRLRGQPRGAAPSRPQGRDLRP